MVYYVDPGAPATTVVVRLELNLDPIADSISIDFENQYQNARLWNTAYRRVARYMTEGGLQRVDLDDCRPDALLQVRVVPQTCS